MKALYYTGLSLSVVGGIQLLNYLATVYPLLRAGILVLDSVALVAIIGFGVISLLLVLSSNAIEEVNSVTIARAIAPALLLAIALIVGGLLGVWCGVF